MSTENDLCRLIILNKILRVLRNICNVNFSFLDVVKLTV